jgi:hypothetical protein
MAYEASYFAEQHLILIRVWGTVSLDENREIGQRLNAMLDQADAKADVLFDLRRLERFPTSLNQLRQASAVVRSPRLGWIILLTSNILLKFVATVLIQVQTQSVNLRVFETPDAATPFLQRTHPIPPSAKHGWLI